MTSPSKPLKRRRPKAEVAAPVTESVKDNPVWKPYPEKVNLLVNVFTYDCQMGADVFSYCCSLGKVLQDHPRVENAVVSYTYGYPTTRARNFAVKKAKADGFHYLLMLDDDIKPDVVLGQNGDPNAVPFMPTAIDFALAHDGPCCVGAPYCGAPPEQRVMVMKNIQYAPDQLDGMGVKLGSYTRDEASVQRGIQRVSALPTGCLLVDLRVLEILPPPWFEYEYADPPFNTQLASTEDVVFTRNLDWLQVPQYCAWDCWAGHKKLYMTGKPRLSPIDSIPNSIREAIFYKGWKPAKTFDGADLKLPDVTAPLNNGNNGNVVHSRMAIAPQ